MAQRDVARSSHSLKLRIACLAIMLLGSIAVCLPWSVHASLAVKRFNATASDLPLYDRAQPPWTVDARTFMDSLPAFARGGKFGYFTQLARQAGDPQVTRIECAGCFCLNSATCRTNARAGADFKPRPAQFRAGEIIRK